MMLIDTNEPTQVLPQISQAVPAKLWPLNQEGWADYRWEDCQENRIHAERKTWQDLTSSLESIEYQLRRQKHEHPEARLILIVEGVALPSSIGTVVYHKSKGARRDVFYASRVTNARYSQIMAWLYQVGKYLEIYYTASLDATCQALVAFYHGDQKPEHGTFQRYIRSMDWHPNPQVESLMAIGRGAGIGAAKAEALIRKFGTVWAVLNANPNQLREVAGLGHSNSLRLLRKVGRVDV